MTTSKIGIVVCSRTDSSRLPGKPFLKVKGKYLIAHLLDRLVPTGIPVYLAVPYEELPLYQKKLADYVNGKTVFLFGGSKCDPLKRTHDVAQGHGLDHIVRITHDKVFINYKQLDHFICSYFENKFDYIYSTNFIPGMGFEIFSRDVLKRARAAFKNVEHLSYAVESVAKNVCNLLHFPYSRTWLNRKKPRSGLRLLIDYPPDVENIRKLMTDFGSDCGISKIVEGIEDTLRPNAQPDVTVYTCSYEDIEHLDRCIQSVLGQSLANFEYLLIDDGSIKHPVSKLMGKYKKDPRVHVVQNQANRGLASSSNVGAAMARGRYVIRLDADDYFVDEKVLERMVRSIEFSNADILYPHNYKDGRIQEGCEQHHVGGTMFKKRTLDYLRFTDGLRHYEGLDIYHRAMLADRRIEYFPEPTFYYRQRSASLSNAPSAARAAVKAKLDCGVVGDDLLEDVG